MGLILDDMDQIQIPRFTELFEQQISDIVVQSKEQTDASKITYARAENLLLEALGLTDFVPSLESVNVKSFKESFATTGRLDSEFYQPKFEKLINILSKDNLTIGNLAPAQHERFSPKRTGTFQYIEIGAVQSEGIATSETIEQSEAPSRASEIVKSGNVITSTVRPIRRLSALVLPTQDGYVCSSGFAVLKPIKILSETLLTYLRLPLVCELLDLYTTSSLYPAISEKDLLSIPIPNVPVQIQTKIAEHVQESFTLKAKSEHLLETAKRAVEMAIEQNEQTALAWLTLEIKPRT